MSCCDDSRCEWLCKSWRIYDTRLTLAASASADLGIFDIHARTAGDTSQAAYTGLGTTLAISGHVLRWTSQAIAAPNILLILQEAVPASSNFLGTVRQWVLAGVAGQVDQGEHVIHGTAFRLLAFNMSSTTQAQADISVTVRES